jgi:outer membrane murein-binding lipoprotein Lpp
LAKVDPFVAPIPRKFLNDPELRPFFEYLNRFLHDLFIRTGGGDDSIESIEEATAAEADTSRLFATIGRLNKRVHDLEASSDNEVLNSKIAKLNQKVNKLISELLAAVKDLAPDKEQESEKVVLLANIRDEIMLLNARVEEAFETELDGGDI